MIQSNMGRPAKRAKLLADGESESEEQAPQQNGFSVNQEYAYRFEHNKKREERQQLEEKFKPSGKNGAKQQKYSDEGDEDSEDDESEDDDADLATKDLDDEIFATLNAIKEKDPRVYNKEVKFYRDFDAEDGAAEDGVKKEKPMYLQDYHRQNLLAGNAGGEGDDEDAPPRTYQQEQDAMRQKLVGSMHADGGEEESEASDEGDDFLVAKAKPKHNDLPTAKTRPITDNDVAAADKDPETYLSNFMAARAWLPADGSQWKAFESDDSGDDERADAFEEAYNMRFEDPKTANEKLQSFSRDVGKYGVRRDEKGGRKRGREREKEQKEQAKREREEERARLRKLKIEDAEEKVKRIKDAAGMRGQELDLEQWRDIIEGDFEDEKWEAEMRRRFGEEYYAEEEGGEEFDEEEVEADGKGKPKLKKPKWDDDLDIKDLVPDFEGDEKPTATPSSDEEDEGGVTLPQADDNEDVSEAEQAVKKKKKTKKDRAAEKTAAKRTARLERRAIENMVDKSIPILPGNPTPHIGFRYRETSPTSFGLSARDILFADDAQLNQFAGLKKMAAFREEDKKARDKKKFSKKGRLRQWRKETFGSVDGPAEPKQVASGANVQVVGGGEAEGGEVDEGGNVREGERGKKRKRSKKGKGVKA